MFFLQIPAAAPTFNSKLNQMWNLQAMQKLTSFMAFAGEESWQRNFVHNHSDLFFIVSQEDDN